MKKPNHIIEEAHLKAKGRKVSAAIHIAILGLLVFPFMQATLPQTPEEVQIVMDFSSGSSEEGAKRNTTKKALTPKAIPAKVIEHTIKKEKVVIEKTPPVEEPAEIKNPEKVAEESKVSEVEEAAEEEKSSMGAGEIGKGDAAEGSATSGSDRGYIEGSGVLTRAVIDRGNTKALAQKNGTLILKICINRKGLVTYAEWDKDASTIKDSKVARTALDNVLQYRFEKNRSAPSKECGRLTYIIDVN